MLIVEKNTRKEYDVSFSRTNGGESVKCPICVDDRKKKNVKSLSWDHPKNCGKCHHCEATFSVKRERKPQKEYFRPVFNNSTDLSDNVVKWFQGRSISQATLQLTQITEGLEWMPQTGKQENTIQFNYFREGQLVNTKYRDGAKNFKMVKDAELIFYNLDDISDHDTCIITEGEIDCLSWIEAGIPNVVSVPNGASKGSASLDYLENCIEYFDGKTKIYLSTDNDEPGRVLRDELARRLGIERCYKIEFGALKDANEYLTYHGADKLKSLLDQATDFPMEGVYSIQDTWGDIEDIYFNGLPQGAKTGDPQMDGHIGFMPGELTVVTGIPGHGKSIYLDQLAIGLSIHSGWKFAICSPESYPLGLYFTRLIKRILGKKFSRNNINLTELDRVRTWLSDRFYMIMPSEGYHLNEILSKARQLVMRKGINALILDPWNRIEKSIPHGMNDGNFIVMCLTQMIEFAQRSGVHVFLVAHPTKMQKDKDGINFTIPNLYSISGSAHFFNVAHNGMTIYRNNLSQKTEVYIQKVKWEHLGKVGMMEYCYNEDNSRFDNTLIPDYSDWMKTKIYPDNKQTRMDMDDVIAEINPTDQPPF